MATYYVDAARPDNSGDGLSWATAKKTIAAAVTLAAGGAGPHTINVQTGTYAEQVYFNSANHVGITLNGMSRTGTIIAPANAHVLLIDTLATGGTVQTLTLKPDLARNAVYKVAAATGWTIQDVDLVSASASHAASMILSLGGDATIRRCRFRMQYAASTYAIQLQTNASGTIAYNTIEAASFSKTLNGGVYMTGSGVLNVYNNVILDCQNVGFASTAGTNTLKNNVIEGSLLNLTGSCINQSVGGTVSASRNFLIAPALAGARWIVGSVTEGVGVDVNLKTNANPQFRSHSRVGYIVPRVDDTINFAYAQSVAAALAVKGMRGTYFLEQNNWNVADNATLRAMVTAGAMEIAVHTYSHSDMTFSGQIFGVVKAAETITISRAAGTITLSGGGSVTSFKTKTLAQIKTALEALGATVTPVAAYNTGLAGQIAAVALGEVIADGTAVNAINALVDSTGATGLYKAEMADPKAWLAGTIVNGGGNVTDPQTGVTYVANTLGYPFMAENAASTTAVRTLGYTAASSTPAGGYPMVAAGVLVDAFNVYAIGADLLAGADEATTRANCAAFAFGVAHAGLIVSVISHTAAVFSLNQWAWALDEWFKYGSKLKVTSLQLLAADLNSAAWTNNGNGTYSRTYGYGDHNPQDSSPLVNAGMDVGLTTDFAGNAILDRPDIGAYEYQSLPDVTLNLPAKSRTFSLPAVPRTLVL